MAALTEIDYDPFAPDVKAPKGTPANWEAINAASMADQPNRDNERLRILQEEHANESNPANKAALERDIKRMGATAGSSKVTEVDYDPFESKPSAKPVEQKKTEVRTKSPENDTSVSGKLKEIGNMVAGAVRGAGSIGATILAPYDMAKDAIDGKGLSLESNRKRRADMDAGMESMGADPKSLSYGAGKVGTEIAGTAGVGGGLAALSRAAAPTATGFANALASGGFTTGNNLAKASFGAKAADMGTRVAAGASTGLATTAMADPENAGTGAVIGGALPPTMKIAGKAGKLINKGASAVGKNILGVSTGTGAESISAAYHAGKNKSTEFLDNMRGKVSFNDVVDDAKAGLQKMRADRSAAYRSGMVDISNDKAVIDFDPIASAVSKIKQMGSYKGQQINKNAAGTVDDIATKVNEWASLDPAGFHTPEGLDALKQAIGDIRDSTQFGTAARRAADNIYNSIKDQITAQAPTYSKVMKDYSQASSTLAEIEKALSLGDKASRDTSIRKLQSLLRNNAQTNYGNRLNLAKTLEGEGGANLLSSIAGQTMSSATPRGMTGAIQKGGALLSAAGTGGASIPMTIAAAPFTSPRLVGEALYGMGRLSGGTGNAANSAAQGLARLATQNPALLETRNALYRASPLMAISASREARQ